MKALKLIVVVALITISFFVGRYYELLFDRSIPEGSIVIEQELHDWSIDGEKDTKPVYVKIFAKNTTVEEINGAFQFKVNLDHSGLEKSFIDSLIKIIGEEYLVKIPDKTERFKAIAAYIKRGKKLPEGMDYEPISSPDKNSYSTTITKNINLNAGETKKIELEVMIPPKFRGYIFKIKQE